MRLPAAHLHNRPMAGGEMLDLSRQLLRNVAVAEFIEVFHVSFLPMLNGVVMCVVSKSGS